MNFYMNWTISNSVRSELIVDGALYTVVDDDQ